MVEDEQEIYDLTKLYFDKENLVLDHVSDGHSAIRYIANNKPDLVLLDVGLPDISGFEVILKIKEISDVPVIFLTSKQKVQDQITGLRSGAEDYILKPFHPQLLTEKVRIYLKRHSERSSSSPSSVLKFNHMTIDHENQSVHIGSIKVPLTQTEFQILSILAEQPGLYFSSDAIYEKLWFENAMGDTRGVLVHISNLRKKLHKIEPNKTFIMTKRNHGYKFNEHLCEAAVN
jgi:DNA-binding response OmpR family regulator